MTGKQAPVIPGIYRQHILAGVIIAGPQRVGIDTHGGGPGAAGSHITASFGQQLMITLYDMVAATVYIQAWLARTTSGSSKASRPRPRSSTDTAASARLSVRAHGEDRRFARYDSASRTAIIRVGSLTWTVEDQAGADSMRAAWRHIADLAPIILGRQAPTRARRPHAH
jgi:hypothetical protein